MAFTLLFFLRDLPKKHKKGIYFLYEIKPFTCNYHISTIKPLRRGQITGLSELDLMILDLFHYSRKHAIGFHSLSPVLLKRKRRLNNNRKTNENRVSLAAG